MSSTEPEDEKQSSSASVFSRLRIGPRRKIPFIAQLTPTDCGAASLSMALAYHGKEIAIHTVRNVLGGGRNGVTAKQILLAARTYGFRARGVGVDLDTLQFLSPGSILHWELTHFVVFERSDKRNLYIVDPALGRRKIPLTEAGKSITGVAILLEPSEAFTTEKAERKTRYKRYIDWLMGARGIWSRVLLVSVFLQLLALAVPGLTGAIVDKVVPRSDFQLLYLVAAGCLSIASFQFLSTFLRSRLLLHLRTQIETRMSLDFVEHLLALPYSFFQQRTTGDLMMRMSSQSAIRELLTTGALSALLDGVLVLVYFGLLLGAAPWLALVAAVLAILQITVVVVASRKITDMMTEGLATQARLSSYQVELLAGIETIKSMGAAPRATSRWTDLYVDVLNVSLARGRLEGSFQSLMGTLGFVGPIALLLTGAYQVLDGTLSIGIMLGLSALGQGFLGPVTSLVGTGMALTQVKSYMERLEDVLDAPVEPTRPNLQSAGRPLSGRIEVRALSFRYPSEQTPTLDDVSFEIGSGECVAIVGASGSGKSTLARLLAGLYTPASGTIAFDGTDMATLDLGHLRERLGIVTQDTRLFSGTLRDNVTLFEPSVAQESVQAACELAGLHPDITRMPMGYETMLADGGSSLSGGQRQRLSLARALLRSPDILILDEATSALDTITEQLVQSNLRRLNCTRVLVAHRLSTIIESDKIIVLEQGKVVAVGRHDELLQHSQHYRALVHAQHDPRDSTFRPQQAAARSPGPAQNAAASTRPSRAPQPVTHEMPAVHVGLPPFSAAHADGSTQRPPAVQPPSPSYRPSAMQPELSTSRPPGRARESNPSREAGLPTSRPPGRAQPGTQSGAASSIASNPPTASSAPSASSAPQPDATARPSPVFAELPQYRAPGPDAAAARPGPSGRPPSVRPPPARPTDGATRSQPPAPIPTNTEALRARLSAKGGLDRTEPLELSRRKSGA